MSPQNVRLIRSITVCARMPGRQMDGAISVFLSDPLISITRSLTVEMPGSTKEH